MGNRTRTALLAAVSHDLRTPLASIKAAVTSLRQPDMVWSPEDEAALLETVEESADRLDALIDNLLDASRLQADAVRPSLRAVSIDEVLPAALAGLADRSAVRFEAEDELGSHATLACWNACSRTFWRTPSGTHRIRSSVVISPGRVGDRLHIRVVDTGPDAGGGEEFLFAPFQRLGDVPAGSGVGLGLAVARGLTEAMGGQIWAEDTPGGGLTMVIDLPSRAGGAGTAAGGAMTFVLVVDDDPLIVRTLEINLRAQGYDVESARDGRASLEIAAERKPDVVVLDLGLPDLDGVRYSAGCARTATCRSSCCRRVGTPTTRSRRSISGRTTT